jgi:hypothetical protein
MHHYHDIQPVGWMRLETTNEYIPPQCRQGLVIYFDVSNGKPAFLNSFHLSRSDEFDIVAKIQAQISSAFSKKSAKNSVNSIEQRG